MSDWMNNFSEKLVTLCLFIIWSVISLVLLWLIGSFMYKAFHTPSDFHKLNVKVGVLTHVGTCINRKGVLPHIPVEIKVNERNEKVSLPCGQQVSMLNDEIGEVIEIRSDPQQISYLANSLNIWHVASKKRTYFDYHKAIEKSTVRRKHGQNIICISIFFTVILILKNFSTLRWHIIKVFDRDKSKLVNTIDEIVFEPNNRIYGVMFWALSILTIITMYSSLFISIIFFAIAAPLTAVVFLFCWVMRKNTHRLKLSPIGIEYEPFRKVIGTDTLRWDEVGHIDTLKMKGIELIQISLLNNVKRRSIFTSLSGDLTIGPSNFKNGGVLKVAVFQMYSSFKDNNSKEHG